MPPSRDVSAPPKPDAPVARNMPCIVAAKKQRRKMTLQAPDAHVVSLLRTVMVGNLQTVEEVEEKDA
ncbi:hypothetical protein EMCG_02575 [[Emmonsia] crescens]|uniref:Uncharacterized protein n=1 Tax=[Emmonsia] crescens TaxID=73230 RepID=A0A0G2J1B7_9EURO|nr:hypothetical protein EMCG_02575 [Emmonsia crescens UAMH 3008]